MPKIPAPYPPLWASTKRHSLRRASPCGTVGRLSRGLNRASIQRVGDTSDAGASRANLKRATLYRAGETPSCGPPTTDGLLWLNNLGDPAGLMTKNGSQQVSTWFNQFTGPSAAVDSTSTDAHGVPLAPAVWPVWTTGVQNGLPAMLWSRAAGTNMNGNYSVGTLNKPTADGAAVTFLAVVRPFDLQGGAVLTMRMSDPDYELMMWHYGPAPAFQQPTSSAQDANGTLFNDGIVDYSNQTILVDYTYFDAATPLQVFVNGVQRPLLAPGTQPIYSGVSGYSIGFCNAIFSRSWNGYIMEILGYVGSSSTIRAAAREYLRAKWAVY